MEPLLNYALDGNGIPVHVDNVVKGKACGCYCPSCNKPLSARQGPQRQHHFAHVGNRDCKGAYETILHMLAKKVLLDTGMLMLPSYTLPGYPSGLVKLHNIQSEIWDEESHIRPDVEGIMENGERLLIEFYVSHRVDGKKLKTIVDKHLKCVEIDLNYQLLDETELRDFLTKSKEYRDWVRPLYYVQNLSESFSYGPSPRNPLYAIVRDKLKKIYDQETLRLHPYCSSKHQYVLDSIDCVFDLKELGYDVCDMHYNYRGLKHGLLFSKSIEETKIHAVSINVRGKSRRKSFMIPKGLLIIDIVLKSTTTINNIVGQWEEADIYKTIEVTYYGFQEWLSKEKQLHQVLK